MSRAAHSEHPLQRQIADALRLEIAPLGKVSRDGVVWWSVDHAAYAGTAPGARVGRGIIAGVPDLFVLFRGIAHMIEIKAAAGELSDPQQSVMSAVLARRWPGWRSAQCQGDAGAARRMEHTAGTAFGGACGRRTHVKHLGPPSLIFVLMSPASKWCCARR